MKDDTQLHSNLFIVTIRKPIFHSPSSASNQDNQKTRLQGNNRTKQERTIIRFLLIMIKIKRLVLPNELLFWRQVDKRKSGNERMDGWLDGCMYGWVHGGKENHFVFIKQNTNKKRNAACVFSLIKSFELTEKKKKQKTITITNQ